MVAAGGAGELIWPASFRGYPPDILGSTALPVVLSPVRLLEIVGLLSLPFLLSVLTYVTQFAHPFVDPWAALSYWRRSLQGYRYGQFIFGESLGVLSILPQSVLLMGLILPAVRRWPLRPGSLTLVFTLNAFLMAFMQDYYAFVVVAAAAGVVADVLPRGNRVECPAMDWDCLAAGSSAGSSACRSCLPRLLCGQSKRPSAAWRRRRAGGRRGAVDGQSVRLKWCM